MKKQLIILVAAINIFAAYNAFAAVGFYTIRIQTSTSGWITRTVYDQMTNDNGTYNFTTIVPSEGTLMNAKVLVYNDNPDTPFYRTTWKTGAEGEGLLGHEYTTNGKLIYESYWNMYDYTFGQCLSVNYMSFQFRYYLDGPSTEFLFHVTSGCQN